MRGSWPVLLVVLCGRSAADPRIDTEPIPDLGEIATAFSLDRYVEPAYWTCGTYHHAVSVVVGAGVADRQGKDARLVAASSIGGHSDNGTYAITNELETTDLAFRRGRHAGMIELSFGDDEPLIVRAAARAEHGEARALAPAWLGPGRRATIDARGDVLLPLGREKNDFRWVAAIEGGAGGTWWEDDASAARQSIGLGIGRAPTDGEIPRGTIDLLRGRVERIRIDRPATVAAASTAEPLPARTTEVRVVELGLGARDLTFHVDREVLAVLVADLGWSFLEADADAGSIAAAMFRMRMAGAMRWRIHADGKRGSGDGAIDLGTRQLGLAIAREPGYTADGQRLVADWRVMLEATADRPGYIASASGGISWLSTVAGGDGDSRAVLRYASSFEAYAKVGAGFELGAYTAIAFEPHVAGEPRAWSTEAGVVARFRRAAP